MNLSEKEKFIGNTVLGVTRIEIKMIGVPEVNKENDILLKIKKPSAYAGDMGPIPDPGRSHMLQSN